MKKIINFLFIFICLVTPLSSCDDDFMTDFETRYDEYCVYYRVTYSTVYDFHNIAYVNFTDFFDDDYKYTGRPKQVVQSIDGTSEYIKAERVPKGSHIEFSTYVDVKESLPNTKVEISIEIRKGNEIGCKEVAKASAECPLKDNPLKLSFDIPTK